MFAATLKQRVKLALTFGARWISRREYRHQRFKRHNERAVEFAFVFRKLSEVCPHEALDVGTGTTALPHLMRNCGPLVTAIDNVTDYWPHGLVNRHYHVIDDDITEPTLTARFDLITCISVLEHIEAADRAVASMLGLLRLGGHLLLTFPYTEDSYVRSVYDLPGSTNVLERSYITQSFSRANVDRWLEATPGARLIEQEYWRFWTGDHWTVGEKVLPPQRATADSSHQISCLHIQRGH